MKKIQNRVLFDAYKILRELMLTKSMNEGTKRAIRVRLEALLENEEKMYEHWKSNIKEKLNPTRQKQIEREYLKVIQAMKIVIHKLTPYFERTSEVPTFVVRKNSDKDNHLKP